MREKIITKIMKNGCSNIISYLENSHSATST